MGYVGASGDGEGIDAQVEEAGQRWGRGAAPELGVAFVEGHVADVASRTQWSLFSTALRCLYASASKAGRLAASGAPTEPVGNLVRAFREHNGDAKTPAPGADRPGLGILGCRDAPSLLIWPHSETGRFSCSTDAAAPSMPCPIG